MWTGFTRASPLSASRTAAVESSLTSVGCLARFAGIFNLTPTQAHTQHTRLRLGDSQPESMLVNAAVKALPDTSTRPPHALRLDYSGPQWTQSWHADVRRIFNACVIVDATTSCSNFGNRDTLERCLAMLVEAQLSVKCRWFKEAATAASKFSPPVYPTVVRRPTVVRPSVNCPVKKIPG
ncbi:hypothetical protein DFH06DRAFT_1121130 [Mycena polygramma]|nr:hypothetical protein DFH06DRAFT_1121130 [Mycena polygramma]